MSVFANNRFLKRVNPEIVRAKDDSGSSLNHPEIQRLMRQMVDLDIADNLKLWVHNGLVKTRTSGSDTFVPKAYDISGEENDAVQATNDEQPKLVSDGISFAETTDLLDIPHTASLAITDYLTSMIWFYPTSTTSTHNGYIFNKFRASSGERCWFIRHQVDPSNLIRVQVRNIADNTNLSVDSTYDISENLNTWVHIALVYDKDNELQVYINGSINNQVDAIGSINNQIRQVEIGNLGTANPCFGLLNDARHFNKALSATEISAIFNATKGFYGIT